jgi:hypothetical protein
MTLELTIGSAGAATLGNGDFGATAIRIATITNEFTFNPTISNTFELYAQHSAADTSIFSYMSFIKKL